MGLYLPNVPDFNRTHPRTNGYNPSSFSSRGLRGLPICRVDIAMSRRSVSRSELAIPRDECWIGWRWTNGRLWNIPWQAHSFFIFVCWITGRPAVTAVLAHRIIYMEDVCAHVAGYSPTHVSFMKVEPARRRLRVPPDHPGEVLFREIILIYGPSKYPPC